MDMNSIKKYLNDKRIILTLDAGGSKLEFSAYKGKQTLCTPFVLPASPDNLDSYLGTMAQGFTETLEKLGNEKNDVCAISFGFPGPADYEQGIICDLPNLPAFRGGVALKAFLERKFGFPVFINNDGNLFALGEWIDGFLPWVNAMFEARGKTRRYRNLIGITLGTGLGCGIVIDGKLIIGDNSSGGEIWPVRNRLVPEYDVELSVGKKALRIYYSKKTGIPLDEIPDPITLEMIAKGKKEGDRKAAADAYRDLGVVAGDAIALALTLIDGLVVIGGGLAHAKDLYLSTLVEELHSTIRHPDGREVPRLIMKAYNLEDPVRCEEFFLGKERIIPVPGSDEQLAFDPLFRTGIGLTRLGTGRAVSLGAYVFALMKLDSC